MQVTKSALITYQDGTGISSDMNEQLHKLYIYIYPQLCGTSFHHLSLPTPCKAMKDQMGIILLNSRIFGESRKVKLPPRLKDFIKKDLRGHNQHTSHSSLFVGVMVLDVLVLVRIFATFQLFCYTSPDFGDWHGKVEDIRQLLRKVNHVGDSLLECWASNSEQPNTVQTHLFVAFLCHFVEDLQGIHMLLVCCRHDSLLCFCPHASAYHSRTQTPTACRFEKEFRPAYHVRFLENEKWPKNSMIYRQVGWVGMFVQKHTVNIYKGWTNVCICVLFQWPFVQVWLLDIGCCLDDPP